MGNRLEGTASFEYEGQQYELTLNNRVLMHAEDVLDYSALDAAEEARNAMAQGRNPRLRTVVAIFYGALVQNHPEVTEDDAVDMFMDDESNAAQDAFKAVLLGVEAPEAKVGNAQAPKTEPPKKRSGTGKKSTGPTGKRGSRAKTSS